MPDSSERFDDRNPESGDRAPEDAGLVDRVYAGLRAIARRRMAEERRDHTLQTTALVHEAWLRLSQTDPDLSLDDRSQFFRAAAEAMRRVLIEHARKRGRLKRGGGLRRWPLSVVDLASDEDSSGILAVDDALGRLEQRDATMAAIVELRFFAGLSEQETAEALGMSERTVRREWALARSWLHRELERED